MWAFVVWLVALFAWHLMECVDVYVGHAHEIDSERLDTVICMFISNHCFLNRR